MLKVQEEYFWEMIDILDELKVLPNIMIIGSWAEYLFPVLFDSDFIPNIHTRDVDLFYRNINLPNTSYGEDYALGLRISRTWQIGRIYDVLYLCRRWEDNSDASLDVIKMNGHNTYKDRIRTWELQARIALNKSHE